MIDWTTHREHLLRMIDQAPDGKTYPLMRLQIGSQFAAVDAALKRVERAEALLVEVCSDVAGCDMDLDLRAQIDSFLKESSR